MAAEDANTIRARSSVALGKDELMEMLSRKEDYDEVLAMVAKNVKMGPWTATSGLVLEYYLNAATNFMDKHVATACTRMTLDVVRAKYKKHATDDQKLVVVGLEMAGGVMVGQCACLASVTHPDVLEWCDFVYCRKDRKKSGTCQQLEGPNHLTLRTKDSPLAPCIILDDANSSGSSLKEGAQLMMDDYNMQLVGAVYLVDRSRDRKTLPAEKLGRTHEILQTTDIAALYDLEEVDTKIDRSGKTN